MDAVNLRTFSLPHQKQESYKVCAAEPAWAYVARWISKNGDMGSVSALEVVNKVKNLRSGYPGSDEEQFNKFLSDHSPQEVERVEQRARAGSTAATWNRATQSIDYGSAHAQAP